MRAGGLWVGRPKGYREDPQMLYSDGVVSRKRNLPTIPDTRRSAESGCDFGLE
jgi:hypothetical protein